MLGIGKRKRITFNLDLEASILAEASTNRDLSQYRKHGAFFAWSMKSKAVLTTPEQADKLRNQQELERLQAKFIGTGHPDTTSWEWKTNIHRDTYSSIAGHPPLLSYLALAENEPVAKVRVQMIRVLCPLQVKVVADADGSQKMLQPAGPPPPREEDTYVAPRQPEA
jgi:splicing factor 3B subunit 5